MIEIESTTIEGLTVHIVTREDPTATAPTFGVTTGGREDPPGTMETGSWLGTWNARTGRISAQSATLGAVGADLDIAAGSVYDLWMHWETASESPTKRCGEISVR